MNLSAPVPLRYCPSSSSSSDNESCGCVNSDLDCDHVYATTELTNIWTGSSTSLFPQDHLEEFRCDNPNSYAESFVKNHTIEPLNSKIRFSPVPEDRCFIGGLDCSSPVLPEE
ncbi:hypothetical protein RCL1_007464 [Eukaryota sp. TZLM3-RCL]